MTKVECDHCAARNKSLSIIQVKFDGRSVAKVGVMVAYAAITPTLFMSTDKIESFL